MTANSDFTSLVDIRQLPFFFGLLNADQIADSALPRFLPFSWGIDLHKGLFRQLPSLALAEALELAYMSPVTIAPPPGEGEFGKHWADTVAGVLGKFIPVESICGKSVLEIGCSNGLLLSYFAAHGASCVGVEPGPQAEACSQRPGVKVLRSYFENADIDEKFDFVYAINVLEHVSDLDGFLEKLGQVLKPGGTFVAAIPDSEMEMSAVTPNLFVHEHYWYFTPDTIKNFLAGKGFHKLATTPSPFGSNFFVTGTWTEQDPASNSDTLDLANAKLLERGQKFASQLTSMLGRLQKKIDAFADSGNSSIGLYGASNAINYLGLLDWKITPRIFDTDRANHGKYLWSSRQTNLKVEAPEPKDLCAMDEIWILPVAHQVSIRKYLVECGVSASRIADHKGESLESLASRPEI